MRDGLRVETWVYECEHGKIELFSFVFLDLICLRLNFFVVSTSTYNSQASNDGMNDTFVFSV